MACRELGIDIRTRQRWLKDAAEGGVNTDGRKDAERKKPVGALSEEERERVLEIADSPEYASKAPAQIVATLADKGEWVASESTFYRILHEKNQQHIRGKAKSPNRKTPTSHAATAPNQVWTWDITYSAPVIRCAATDRERERNTRYPQYKKGEEVDRKKHLRETGLPALRRA